MASLLAAVTGPATHCWGDLSAVTCCFSPSQRNGHTMWGDKRPGAETTIFGFWWPSFPSLESFLLWPSVAYASQRDHCKPKITDLQIVPTYAKGLENFSLTKLKPVSWDVGVGLTTVWSHCWGGWGAPKLPFSSLPPCHAYGRLVSWASKCKKRFYNKPCYRVNTVLRFESLFLRFERVD